MTIKYDHSMEKGTILEKKILFILHSAVATFSSYSLFASIHVNIARDNKSIVLFVPDNFYLSLFAFFCFFFVVSRKYIE